MGRSTRTGRDAGTPPAAAEAAAAFGRLGLALMLVASFMVVLDFSIVNVALSSSERELGISAKTVQWVVTAHVIAFGGLLIPWRPRRRSLRPPAHVQLWHRRFTARRPQETRS